MQNMGEFGMFEENYCIYRLYLCKIWENLACLKKMSKIYRSSLKQFLIKNRRKENNLEKEYLNFESSGVL